MKSGMDLPVSSAQHQNTSYRINNQTPSPSQNSNNVISIGNGRVVDQPSENDVLTGRGASINAHPGNKKFRALCFIRKAHFDASNHAAKRHIANEIVTICMEKYGSRFLCRKLIDNTNLLSSLEEEQNIWYVMSKEQAILKASQVMRDYKRPDRVAQRELMAAQGRRRKKLTTPMEQVEIPPAEVPLIENPVGVNSNDVICGRGAFANEHTGNKYLRALAVERKARFEAANFNEKKMLASEIVKQIADLDPPGRFMKRIPPNQNVNWNNPLVAVPSTADDCGWIQLDHDMAVRKACQVMRDIARPDRHERDEKRRRKRLMKAGYAVENAKRAQSTTTSLSLFANEKVQIRVGDTIETDEKAVGTIIEAEEKQAILSNDVHELKTLEDV